MRIPYKYELKFGTLFIHIYTFIYSSRYAYQDNGLIDKLLSNDFLAF